MKRRRASRSKTTKMSRIQKQSMIDRAMWYRESISLYPPSLGEKIDSAIILEPLPRRQ